MPISRRTVKEFGKVMNASFSWGSKQITKAATTTEHLASRMLDQDCVSWSRRRYHSHLLHLGIGPSQCQDQSPMLGAHKSGYKEFLYTCSWVAFELSAEPRELLGWLFSRGMDFWRVWFDQGAERKGNCSWNLILRAFIILGFPLSQPHIE